MAEGDADEIWSRAGQSTGKRGELRAEVGRADDERWVATSAQGGRADELDDRASSPSPQAELNPHPPLNPPSLYNLTLMRPTALRLAVAIGTTPPSFAREASVALLPPLPYVGRGASTSSSGLSSRSRLTLCLSCRSASQSLPSPSSQPSDAADRDAQSRGHVHQGRSVSIRDLRPDQSPSLSSSMTFPHVSSSHAD